MKNAFKLSIFAFTLIICGLQGCKKDLLSIPPPSQYSESFINTKEGINAVLNSAYANSAYNGEAGVDRIYVEEGTTDVLEDFRGSLYGSKLSSFQNFTFDPGNVIILEDNFWQKCYRAIRDANTVIAAAPINNELDDNSRKQIMAEARFIRAEAYQFLYGWFGPVPLIDKPFTSSKDDFDSPRADSTTLVSFILEDLNAAAADLPLTQELSGKATKGAALALEMKFYLQLRKWQEAQDAAQQVIDLGIYHLWPDYTTLFSMNNENNYEMIYVYPAVEKTDYGNPWQVNELPPGYPGDLYNAATQVTTPLAFYNTFHPEDKRRTLFMTGYTNAQGQYINLLTGNEYQNPRSFKYPIDVNANQRDGGQDIPYLRYADVLLSKAEAMVMSTNAVSQKAVDLLNSTRTRAGLNALSMTDVPTTDRFIDTLLLERAWEFYSEGKRREDLLRHDQFISNAIARGKNAKPYQVLFPFPQAEIDADQNLQQNPGF